ncbi:mechanosensitive ion channel family protein [Luteimonas mephitis]|jgi:small-conductance mechanosensitive channel|uniref:mechanosensitive ion channel family protein n=1 Tax=Luteimonas mephitis TaxID=83615 RepID=UPI000420CA5C|nr:mechanosensitive ion channel domain-containing protein [Luteimonas mephitis]
MLAMVAQAAPGTAGERVRDAAGAAVDRGWNDLGTVLDFHLLRTSGLDVTVGGLIAAVLVIGLTWLVSALVRRAVRRFGDRHEGVNRAALYAVSRLIHYVLLLAGILLAMDFAGISLGKFALFASAVGVGLGFGLQAIFGNFIAGLVLLFDRSLKVGDFVELDNDTRGTVHAINIRATRIITNDNIGVLVPNSEFVNGRVVNWTHRSVNRRIRVPFRVAFGVDKELVKKAALEAAARVPFTLAIEGEQRPQVWLVNYGESGVEFLLVVWLTGAAARRNVAIQAAYLWELDSSLKEHGIEVPVPQRDLRMRSAFGLEGERAMQRLLHERVEPEPVATGPEAVAPAERLALAGNDASEDTQRRIAEDEAMRLQAEREAALSPQSKAGHAHGRQSHEE